MTELPSEGLTLRVKSPDLKRPVPLNARAAETFQQIVKRNVWEDRPLGKALFLDLSSIDDYIVVDTERWKKIDEGKLTEIKGKFAGVVIKSDPLTPESDIKPIMDRVRGLLKRRRGNTEKEIVARAGAIFIVEARSDDNDPEWRKKKLSDSKFHEVRILKGRPGSTGPIIWEGRLNKVTTHKPVDVIKSSAEGPFDYITKYLQEAESRYRKYGYIPDFSRLKDRLRHSTNAHEDTRRAQYGDDVDLTLGCGCHWRIENGFNKLMLGCTKDADCQGQPYTLTAIEEMEAQKGTIIERDVTHQGQCQDYGCHRNLERLSWARKENGEFIVTSEVSCPLKHFPIATEKYVMDQSKFNERFKDAKIEESARETPQLSMEPVKTPIRMPEYHLGENRLDSVCGECGRNYIGTLVREGRELTLEIKCPSDGLYAYTKRPTDLLGAFKLTFEKKAS